MKTSTYLAVMVLALIWSSNFLYDLSACPTSKKVLFNVSAYCQDSCCTGSWSDGVTASGYVIQPGDRFVAAPKKYPFGTKMVIPGYADGKVVEVKDRGGAIKAGKNGELDRLDLYFDTHQKALNFGRKNIEVRILP